MKKFQKPTLPAVLCLFAALGLPAHAQWINYSGGTYDYENTANWNGGVINNQFTTNFTGATTLTFGANYTLTSQIFLNCSNGAPSSALNLTLQSATSSPETIKFSTNGGIALTNSEGGVVTIGTAGNPLVLDLNGATNCTIGGSSSTAGTANVAMQINAQVIDSGGASNLLKLGGDRVFSYLNNTNNSFLGPVSFFNLRGGGFTSIKPIGGGPSALGAPVDAVTGTITIADGGNQGTVSYLGSGDTSDRPFVFNVSFSNQIANAYAFINQGTGLLKLTGPMTFPTTSAAKLSQFIFYASNAPLELDGYIHDSGNPTNGAFYTYLCFAGTPLTSTNRITLAGPTNDFRDFIISNSVFSYYSTAPAGVPSSMGAGTNVVLGGGNATVNSWEGNSGQGSSLQYSGPTNTLFTRNIVLNGNYYPSFDWALDNATTNTTLTFSNSIIWSQGTNLGVTSYNPRFLYINPAAPSTNTVLSYLPDAGFLSPVGNVIGVTVGIGNPYGTVLVNGGVVQLLNPTNTFGGGVEIAYGRTLQVATLANIGQPSSIGTCLNNTGTNNHGPYISENGVAVPITGINLGSTDSARGGTLSYIGTNNASCNQHVTVFGSGTFASTAVEVCGLRNDSPNNSSLHFSDPSPWVLQPQGAGASTNAYQAAFGGTAVTTNTFDSVLGDMTNYNLAITPNSGHLLVNGSAWRLTANQTYSGTSMVANATLLVNGSIAPGLGLIVSSGGVLSGTGTMNENVSVLTNGTIAAGDGALGTLTINGNVTNAGTILMKLNASSLTSDHLALGGNTLAYGNGILAVTNVSGTLAAGNSFTLFTAGSFAGTVSSVTPASPGSGLAWDLSNLSSGVLKVVAGAAPQPAITSIVSTGSSIILSGTNGTPGGPFNVLTATNVLTPLSNWVTSTSGFFDGSGHFNVTNATTGSQRFYIIQVP